MIIPDNTGTALSILADYHEDNHNYQLADDLRQEEVERYWTYEYVRTPRTVAAPCRDHVGGDYPFLGSHESRVGSVMAGVAPFPSSIGPKR